MSALERFFYNPVVMMICIAILVNVICKIQDRFFLEKKKEEKSE